MRAHIPDRWPFLYNPNLFPYTGTDDVGQFVKWQWLTRVWEVEIALTVTNDGLIEFSGPSLVNGIYNIAAGQYLSGGYEIRPAFENETSIYFDCKDSGRGARLVNADSFGQVSANFDLRMFGVGLVGYSDEVTEDSWKLALDIIINTTTSIIGSGTLDNHGPRAGFELSPVTCTFDDKDIPLYQALAPPEVFYIYDRYSGFIHITPKTFWEYRKADGTSPVYHQDTGAQLIPTYKAPGQFNPAFLEY